MAAIWAVFPYDSARAQSPEGARPPPTWAVTVAADSRCAREPGFLSQLARQIPAEQRATADAAELVAEVRVVRQAHGQHGSIRVFDRVLASEAGARELDLPASDCADTAEAMGLVLAVLVEAGRGAPAPEPAAEPPPEPPPPPPPPSPPEPPPPPVTRYAWLGPKAGHDLLAAAGTGYGLLPDVALGALLGWGIRPHRAWPVWLDITGFFPQQTSDHKAQFGALYGSVFVCPLHGERARFRARACPGFSAGGLWAKGRGFLETRKNTQPLAFVGLELGGDVRILGPLVLSLVVRPEVPLLRESFVYYRKDGGTPRLHQASPVTVLSLLGLGLRFR